MSIKMSSAAPVGRGTLSRLLSFLASCLLLLVFTVLIFIRYGALDYTRDAGLTASAMENDSTREGKGVGLLAAYFTSGFQGEPDTGELAPLALMPADGTPGSSAMSAHRGQDLRREKVDLTQGRRSFVADASEKYSQAVMARRSTGESLGMTTDDLDKVKELIVVQHEGIIYCPIPKVANTEWKRVLRWMVGIKNWDLNTDHHKLYPIGKTGLEQLILRGPEEARLALESDRFIKFVVVRDPAERMVSAFLNKCVVKGYQIDNFSKRGAPSCDYLTLMPELFPKMKRGSLASNAKLKELVEGDPEDTFFHFVNGIWREAEATGNTCKISNRHLRPQACFCDLMSRLPIFHVMPFSNLSAEAEALAGRLPAALPNSDVEIEGKYFEARDTDAMTASTMNTGVDEARREEIRVFLKERFGQYHADAKQGTQGITHAAEHKDAFLSERVKRVIYKIAEKDYHLLGEYF